MAKSKRVLVTALRGNGLGFDLLGYLENELNADRILAGVQEIPEGTDVYAFNDREHSTILAALRYWQARGVAPVGIQDIATNDGAVEPLDDVEIDALCERFNMGVL